MLHIGAYTQRTTLYFIYSLIANMPAIPKRNRVK